MTTLRTIPRALLLMTSAVVLAGCASLNGDLPAHQPPEGRRTSAAVATPVVDHSAGLRCMDELMLDYGTRDLAVAAEDLNDPARKSTISKYLVISAAADMSKRSRAIRVVAADPAGMRALQPMYLLRGRVGRPAEKTLGVELMVVSTQDNTVVSGVSSRLQKSDAPEDVVLRSLIEGAMIEAFGRLAKVPYWSCLGQRNDDPATAAEIGDWYDAMAARPSEIIGFFQGQLSHRGAYDGPVDGAVNPQFNDAVARYRAALGLSREPRLTREFMLAYFGANHREAKARLTPASSAAVGMQPVMLAARQPVGPVAVAAPAAAPVAAPVAAPEAKAIATAPAPAALALRLGSYNGAREFARGEAVQLNVVPSRDAHVYCFLQDENRQISRFFPNRFQRESRVNAASGLQLPGAMGFEIRMNGKGTTESVACFATEQDVAAEMPASLMAKDFAPLPVSSFDQMREHFARASRGRLAFESFQMKAR